MERETGFEPATSTLARSHSTAELLPLDKRYCTIGLLILNCLLLNGPDASTQEYEQTIVESSLFPKFWKIAVPSATILGAARSWDRLARPNAPEHT